MGRVDWWRRRCGDGDGGDMVVVTNVMAIILVGVKPTMEISKWVVGSLVIVMITPPPPPY
jgi:hypothetical protein